MTREKMLDNIIRKWGFEHSATITFATIMEDKNFTDKMVADVYRDLMDLQEPAEAPLFCSGRLRAPAAEVSHN